MWGINKKSVNYKVIEKYAMLYASNSHDGNVTTFFTLIASYF